MFVFVFNVLGVHGIAVFIVVVVFVLNVLEVHGIAVFIVVVVFVFVLNVAFNNFSAISWWSVLLGQLLFYR